MPELIGNPPLWPLPVTIAHRAGNALASLRAAEDAGADLIEADVWLYRGRLEVRHLKTMGPIPLLWDRWRLASAGKPRLELSELLAAMRSAAEPILDLKGTDVRTAEAVLDIARRTLPARAFAVCSQQWQLLEPFQRVPNVHVVYSVGNTEQLRKVVRHLAGKDCAGISIDQGLLTPATVRALTAVAPVVMTWPVNSTARLSELLRWGVSGIISDNLLLLHRLVQERATNGTRSGDRRC